MPKKVPVNGSRAPAPVPKLSGLTLEDCERLVAAIIATVEKRVEEELARQQGADPA